jgi:hypothetical protein
VRFYPGAGEATVFPVAWALRRRPQDHLEGINAEADGERLGWGIPESAGPDVPQADGLWTPSSVLEVPPQLVVVGERRSDHLRRSASRVRRYAVENGLVVMLTGTYADLHLVRAGDRAQVMEDGRRLVRRVRESWGERFPYVLTVEAQEERSEREGVVVFNTMMLTPSLPREVFDYSISSWPYGLGDGYNGIDVKDWRKDAAGGARAAAGYAAKYFGKSFDGAPVRGQLYRVAQGFQPVVVVVDLTEPHNSAVDAAKAWSVASNIDPEAFFDMREAERPGDACWLSWRAA